MDYRLKRHITNTLLYAAIITALMALIKQHSVAWAAVFGAAGIALLAADRYVEDAHLRLAER